MRSPTARQRKVAAHIRVMADRKLGRETPQWIVELAQPETKDEQMSLFEWMEWAWRNWRAER